jgi:valyl-tRNA synthetase
MYIPKRYDPQEAEPRLQSFWAKSGTYHFDKNEKGMVYSIDTPPPTVSGFLHLGHVYSYANPDFLARYWRMKGKRVFYPMGYDNNGLPTGRYVEGRLGLRATQIGRQEFLDKCSQISEEAERDYQALWQQLGLSIDWRYTYRTNGDESRRISQYSFLDLYRKDLVYQQKAPSIWCPECQTAIAQSELEDLDRTSELITLRFTLNDGQALPISTTRPELLPACVAIFIHPNDRRYSRLIGQTVSVPLFGQEVPILEDVKADPEKGSGAVMCCTFGDTSDVAWWHIHNLPLIETITQDGRLNDAAGEFSGMKIGDVHNRIITNLQDHGFILKREPMNQSVRVHDRCDTPVEYLITNQWFIRILDHKEELLAVGEKLNWFPKHMKYRYRSWVENLAWDWCISRQRFLGVPFPLWYCQSCGEVVLADEDQLPIDPVESQPNQPCQCGSTLFTPERDVFDTWATSSMTPQIVGHWLSEPQLYTQIFPMSLRPQAHEIIRTWAFYTIVKSHYHFGLTPWKDVAISGWGIAGKGMGKISKSREGDQPSPGDMIQQYSADAVRYWAASTSLGKDAIINEDKIQLGEKLVKKLWNVARFSARFLDGYRPPASRSSDEPLLSSLLLTPADRWILSRIQGLIRYTTLMFETYDYAAAKSETENFFWNELADNYLEMCKLRLYDENSYKRGGAVFTLYYLLLTVIKLFAPFFPHITEEIYQKFFIQSQSISSLHLTSWPSPEKRFDDKTAEEIGESLIAIATAVRRYKSEQNLALGSPIHQLQLMPHRDTLVKSLPDAISDLRSVTRAQRIDIVETLGKDMMIILLDDTITAGLILNRTPDNNG